MTFYFFDLETSGFSGRYDRIMQFGGQRTDENFKPISEPDNFLIKMTPDVLPQPEAVLVHGITPQKTISEGISEADFCRYLTSQVSVRDTVIVGYNNIRFDNEFVRFTLWRNLYDAYEWSWKNNCSTWDLLDVVRMTRALRPDGIKWPFDADGKPTNRLEFLGALNNLEHTDAHDALSDVQVLISLARLLKEKQPKLFDYLLKHRQKAKIVPLVESGRPVVYTSGRYPGQFNKTTLAIMVAKTSDSSGALMYDLRADPDEFTNLSAVQLAAKWTARGEDAPYFPVKVLKYNRCPAVAPIEVLAKANGYENLQLNKNKVSDHLKKLQKAKEFDKKLLDALELMWPKKQNSVPSNNIDADSQLYDGFIPDSDKSLLRQAQNLAPEKLDSLKFKDRRLQMLLFLYKVRNFPRLLNLDEQLQWDDFRRRKLMGGGFSDRYFKRLEELASASAIDEKKRYLIEELNLYAQSLMPIPAD